MQKQKKQFIIILIILLIFAGAYVGMRLFHKQQDKKEETEETYVTEVAKEDITAFSYQDGGETLNFTKEGNVWICENDPTLDLEEDAISDLLGNLEKIEAENVIESVEDPSEYGFDHPTNVITFTAESETTTLMIGMKNEITGQYYLTKDQSEPLYLIATAVPEAFEKPLAELVVEDTEAVPETE